MSMEGEGKREREARQRIRINRENLDKGWRAILADPVTRAAAFELYSVCMEHRDVVRDQTGRTSEPDTFRAIGKQSIGHWLANRCMLADHRNWLLLLAENERPLDDGRSLDPQSEQDE